MSELLARSSLATTHVARSSSLPVRLPGWQLAPVVRGVDEASVQWEGCAQQRWDATKKCGAALGQQPTPAHASTHGSPCSQRALLFQL